MKKILIVLLSGILTLSVTAQTITVKFNGTNNTRNYQVLLDGTSYYSNSAIDANSNASVKKEITLTNQQLGSHTIEVYRLRNTGTYTNGTNTPTTGRAIYSNTFQLRQGYDMNISINGNGQVTFQEQRIRSRGGRGTQVTPMADVTFNQLLQSVRSRYSQASKFALERDAFLKTTNYFTTSQVRQLLLLITSEANRLSLAKLAYPRVSDPTNFTELYDVFNTIASRDAMNTFIRNNPNNNNSGSRWGNNPNNNNPNNNNPNNNTRTAMADYQFSQLLQTVNSQYSQSGKVTAITGAFNNTANWFSTSQLRQLLLLVNSESDRLALAKQSYARVSDASAFTSLYDLFYSQSSRDELNNFINGNTNTQPNTRTVMADYQFSQLLQTVNNQYNQGGKFNAINNAFNTTGNYFSTGQIRQLLTLVNSESDRLALAKLSYLRVIDPTNFTTLYDLLTSQASRNELNTYVIQNGGTGTTVQTNTRLAVSEATFNQIYQKARNHIRPSSTVADLKDAFNNPSYYFSTAQLRQLLALVSNSILASETDLLEVAKLSWHRVTDPANFAQILDLFTSQANRDALNAYIQARPY